MQSASAIPFQWTLLWPGLSRLWLRGHWMGLALALGFAGIVNLLVLSTFVWPAVLGGTLQTRFASGLGWLIVLCFWGTSLVTTWRLLPRWLPGADTRGDDRLLAQAQAFYLKGFWYDAEKTLLELLGTSPRDADAHLLLASLYRRTRRNEEARRHLAIVEHLEGGGKWLFEIDQERRLLAQSGEQAEDDSGEPAGSPAGRLAQARAAAGNQQ